MIYQFITNSLIHFITALAACLTIVLLWKSRKSTEVKFLIYLEFFVAIWATAYAMEFASPELNTKILWSKFSYFGIAFLPVYYFLFTTAFSKKRNIITSKNIALLLIIPIVTIALVLSNEKHLLMWPSVTLDSVNNMAYYSHGIGFWFFYAFTEILLLLGLYNLVHSIFKFAAYNKTQSSILIIATLFPIIGNLLYITNLNPYPGFDWTPLSFVLTGLIISFGIFRFRMFNIVPLAKTKLFEMLNDGVIVVNADGYIEDCNSVIYTIFNWQEKSVILEPVHQVFKKYNDLTDALSNNKASIQLEITNEHWSKHFQIKISPIYRNRKFSGNILIFHDITSIIKADEELKRTNKKLIFEIEKREKLIEDLDAFAHTVAHDLRSSLSSIFSASEIMEEIIKLNDKNLLCELTNLINHSANKSIQITHELLLLATTDKTEVECKPLDMASIFNESKNQLTELINNLNASFIVPQEWPQAIGYAPWIEEVWSNYLSNALKYGGTPPEIEVGSELMINGHVKFWVKDNGKGLSQEEQKKLFKNFVRLNPQKADGYGLGLSIVKKIIEKLDGTAGIESEGNGD
ncbi:MAG TPA: histidine kinase N-terminal 7TM domain-containing protein, partial [Draconibacterium sp.]|nr:histidine kinase N-terminal 7TM domain-containing protein [Draconibacterium sp.]